MVGTLGIREIALAAVLSLWFILSVMRQTQKLKQPWIRRLDPFRLVPTWRFFGPHPLTWDYHLYMSLMNDYGEWGEWTDITPNRRKGRFSFLWNPQRRTRKAFFTACRKVLSFRGSDLGRCAGYRILAAYVLSQPASGITPGRKFKISRGRLVGDVKTTEAVFESKTLYMPEAISHEA